MEYIDIRGVHPIYVNGMKAITLVNAKRDITLQEAKELISYIPEVKQRKIDKQKWSIIWNDSLTYWLKWLEIYPNSESMNITSERIANAHSELNKLNVN